MNLLPLASPASNLENSGGKGASLSRLCRLELPVPPGFIITTEAYCNFVASNHLEEVITASLAGVPEDDGEAHERASALIRSAFSTGDLPDDLRRSILEEYNRLDPGHGGVAVRSSATTEDLPDLSFAGQQDTFLNILGDDPLCKAVIDCWSSLWTARAIGYRMRNAIPHGQAALAVVVQKMVPSETSGVMFTANPLTGLLSETVIDATFGLGEALVSGQVEPDHFVADSTSGALRNMNLGGKKTTTRPKVGGGVENLPVQNGGERSLSDGQIQELVAAGQKIQQEYGSPQDIEWAFGGNELFILQSRPITSLFPLPSVSFDPLIIWASFGAVQGLVGPMTPLGQEAIQRVVLGIGKRMKIKVTYEDQDVFAVAGERIWTKVSDVIRNPIGTRLMSGFLGFVEPSLAQILRSLGADPRMGAGQGRLKFSTMRRLLGFFLPVAVNILRNMLRPEQAREHFDAMLEDFLQTVRIDPGADRFERLANFTAFMGAQGGLADALPTVLPRFISIFAPAMASLNLIGHLLPKKDFGDHGFSMPALDVTRGLPRNVTTEMDLELWKAAVAIRSDAAGGEVFRTANAQTLVLLYRSGTLPAAAQSAVKSFMEKYGMRGVGEIDLGQPRWQEDPTPVMHTLQSYMLITPEAAPDLLFEKGAQAAGEAIERLAAEAHLQRGGRIKEKLVRGAARRVRLLMGARESPKFLAIKAMGRVRNVLLGIGDEFALAGTISRTEDLFFLHVSELEALSRQEEHDWKALIAARQLAYDRELSRRQVPRILVSDGRAFYEGVGAETDTRDTLTGSPVSPGVVEGIVHVVLDPRGARLAPGEILVCPGTDPAWTPLFMAAVGLVMEVGGMMTHGSVVAREYGIPGVVGVHQATERLQDGQLIRLNGTTGSITIL